MVQLILEALVLELIAQASALVDQLQQQADGQLVSPRKTIRL